MVIPFIPRFVDARDLAALANMWHLSATAIGNVPERRHQRLTWTAKHFVHEHRPDLSEMAVYKDLTTMLERTP